MVENLRFSSSYYSFYSIVVSSLIIPLYDLPLVSQRFSLKICVSADFQILVKPKKKGQRHTSCLCLYFAKNKGQKKKSSAQNTACA